MRSLFTTLSDLIVLAEEVITRPMMKHQLAALAAEVRHADARPAEDIRATRAALVMVIALEEFFGTAATDETGVRWLIIAGAMLPLLRAEAYAALRNERAGRAGS